MTLSCETRETRYADMRDSEVEILRVRYKEEVEKRKELEATVAVLLEKINELSNDKVRGKEKLFCLYTDDTGHTKNPLPLHYDI